MKKTGILFFTIFSLACLMRFWHISYQSLYMDEGYILTLVKNCNLKEIFVNAINKDPRPPTYYMILHHWSKIFGATEAGARSLTALFGCITIIPVFMIAKKMFNEKTALLSVFLLAINPFNIYYSRMIKEVALVSFSAVTAFLFFLIALEKNKKIYWGLYVLFSLLSIYFHYAAAFMIVSCFIILLLTRNKYSSAIVKNGVLSFFIIFICYLPGFWFMIHNSLIVAHTDKFIKAIHEVPTLIQLLKYSLYSFSWFLKGEIQCWSIFLSGNRRDILNIIPLILLFFIFLKSRYWRTIRNNSNVHMLIAVAIAIPILLELIITRLKIIYFHPRHIAYVSFFVIILVSNAILNIEKTKKIFFISTLVILMIVPVILLNCFQQEDWRNVVDWMYKQYSQKDIVGLFDPRTEQPFFEYYNNSRMDSFGILYDWSYSIPFEDVVVVNKENIEKVKDRLLNNCFLKERIWVVARGADDEGKVVPADHDGLIIEWLDSTYPLVVKRRFDGKYVNIDVICYSLHK